MRAFAVLALLAACGTPAATPAQPAAVAPAVADRPAADAAAAGAATPGLRLPDGVAPIAYDVTLELDPERDAFTGRVAIAIAVAAPATRLWLHAVDLEIAGARLRVGDRDEEVSVLPDDGSQIRGFALPHPVTGRIALAIEYTGRVSDLSGRDGKEEQGLFRQRVDGRWYLYSQSESIFARRIVPCFDEPRFKPAWRVTAIVPPGAVALGNAPSASERALPDGRREVRFAEIAALPSYLVAIAVGPFDVVDAGRLGRAHTPVRIAVARGDGKRTGQAIRTVPKIIDELEAYLDAPLPLAKLDLVAVPRFFGAMENTGLITFDAGVLVGGRELVSVTAHELAHQWFGNAVTPAWWDHLWLSEAFATWLGERVTESLVGVPHPEIAHRARAQALRADDEVDAKALVHPIASSDDVEPAFDAIAYEKGSAVLAMFERFVGEAAFQASLRAYLAAHAGTSVTSQAFIAALGAASSPEVGAALASNLAYPGTPVVELALRCGAAPAIVASTRDGVTVPVCVRFPAAAAPARACFLAGRHTEHALPANAGCPAWVADNDGGRGYYRAVWRGTAPHAPLDLLSPGECLARGDDAALAVQRGELAIAPALAELGTLAAARDPYATLAALAIARAIDPVIGDPVRPAWIAWLAARFADRLTRVALDRPRSLLDGIVRNQVLELAGASIDPATLAAIRAAGDRGLDGYQGMRLRLLAARDADQQFERLVHDAATATSTAQRDTMLRMLGAYPAAFAARVVDVLLDSRFPAAQVWPALEAMLARSDSRTAAWRAAHARFADLIAALPARAVDVIEATAALCDATARAEVAADFAPHLAAIAGGKRALDRTLGAIDRCVARRAAAGDIARALAAAPL